MMRAVNLRREVALFICPELSVGPTSGRPMRRRVAADAPVRPLTEALAERRAKQVSPGSVGPCRGGSRPDHYDPDQVIGQGVPRPSLWRRLRALCVRVEAMFDRIEDSWVGDLLGVVGLAALVVAMSFIVGVLNAGAF
jgi:hypothetical protein